MHINQVIWYEENMWTIWDVTSMLYNEEGYT